MNDFLLPQPSPEGIEETRELYRRKLGKEISSAEAAEVLSRVISYAWNLMRAGIQIEEAKRLEKEAPLGYRVAQAAGPPRLEPDPDVIPLVRRAFELREQGMPLRKLADEMGAAGLKTKKGKRVGPTALMAMLKDPIHSEQVPRQTKGRHSLGTNSLLHGKGSSLLRRAPQEPRNDSSPSQASEH